MDLDGGVDTVEHGAPFGADMAEQFKRNGSVDVLTLSPAVPLANLPAEVTKLSDFCEFNAKVVMQHMIDAARSALDAGIPVGLGTDSSCPFCTQYGFWRELAYFEKYLRVSKKFALHTATLLNATILGIEKITGSIEKNKSADLLVVKGNPLEDLRALENPLKVVVRGKIIDAPKQKKNAYIEEQLDKLLL